MPFNPDTITHPSESEDTCDMVSNTHIPPHSEIFNTYGEHLTNAQLLVQYGFALDVNDNDRVSWRFDDLVRFLDSSSKDSTTTSSSSTTRLELPWDVLVESFDREVFSESELLFDPDTSNTTTMEVFRINCEGKLSWQLWLLIASDRCTRMFPANDIISLLGRLSRYQITLENEDSDRETIAGEDDLSLLLRATQTTIIALCRRRKAGISDGRHLQNQNLGDLVDDLEPSQWRTRLALLQVITELAILDSCEASWQDILK
ncbi:hypothetical protein GYMLUDRAFT_512401 [Collybiopsis luxurians FD-317 M1]|nr:hypothetical protein GYMLUDRAFT_512401 [Collybiopsis luxurians FD-317 M1]